jgi:hypothetical protein
VSRYERTWTVGLSLAAALAATAPTPARAQTADPTRAVEDLAARAHAEYTGGNYSEAIAQYLRVYETSGAPAVLFNVAAIYDRKLHERQLATAYYRRYAKLADAEPSLVRRATDRVAVLKREQADEQADEQAALRADAAPPGPTPAASPTATDTGPTTTRAAPALRSHSAGGELRTIGAAVGVAGLVGVGTSLALGLVAKSKNDEASSLCNGAACASQRGVDVAGESQSFATAATVSFVAGVGFIAIGTGMYLLAPSRRPTPSAFDANISPNGAGIRLRGSF